MKRTVKKITLSRETLRNLDAREAAQALGRNEAGTYPCYPPTCGLSCYGTCPTDSAGSNCCA